MAIYRMLRDSTFGPHEISKMTTAYEVALLELGITDRADPRTEIIAAAIIHRASTGEYDVQALTDFAMRKVKLDVPRITPATANFVSPTPLCEKPD